MTKKAGVIQLSQNDDIRDLVRKCNTNFQVLGSSAGSQPLSRQVTPERLESSINAIYVTIEEEINEVKADEIPVSWIEAL